MNNKCNNEQTGRDGTSQNQRFLPGLDTTLDLLDDRKVEDLLVFAKKYAELVRFYDVEEPVEWATGNSDLSNALSAVEKPISTWKGFFSSDIAVVVASINQYKNKVDLLRDEFEDKLKMKGNKPLLQKYAELFNDIAEKLLRVHKWYKRSTPDHPLKKELEIKIRSSLAPALEKLISYKRGLAIQKEEDFETLIEKEHHVFENAPWSVDYSKIKGDDSIYMGGNREQKIANAALYVDDIFLSVLKAYRELAESSAYYFDNATENYPQHQPHMALFIAFSKLFSYAQKELNGLTRKHLEFYYRDVLRLKERQANPDAVYLIYELAKEATEYDLKKATELTAGKDAKGQEMVYKTEDDLVINKGKVKELKTIFQDIERTETETEIRQDIINIYSAAGANSEDGNGTPFKTPETAWPALGYFNLDEGGNQTGQQAKIGFAIASPQLFLNEGLRKITITIGDSDLNFEELHRSLKIYVTADKEWLTIDTAQEIGANITDSSFYSISRNSIVITIPAAQPAIIAYDKALHGDDYNTKYPVIQFIVDPRKYNQFKSVITSPSQISISVEAQGITDLILSNDDGPLDPTRSFNPFSLIPRPGSSFFIGSKEVFSKKINTIKLSFDRKLKGNGVVKGLFGKLTERINALKVGCDLFSQANWYPLIFEDGNPVILLIDNKSDEPSPELRIVVDKSSNSREFKRTVGAPLITEDVDDFKARIRLSLHYFNGAKNADAEVADMLSPNEKNVPFIAFQFLSLLLELNAIKLDYYSEQTFESGVEQFFHVYPFGIAEIILPSPQIDIISNPVAENVEKDKDDLTILTDYLLPQVKLGRRDNFFVRPNQYSSIIYQQGNLYIGLEGLVLPQNISLLFKIADGTAYDNDSEPPQVNWSYLVNNEWRVLPAEHIISDSTYGLQTTGIVLIDFPKEASANNTIITKGLHWLCLSVETGGDKIPGIIDVIAQANKANFYDQQNDPEHFRVPLPAGSITKLVTKVPEVKLITQPYESFDGKMREEGKAFYARVSERLRHKHRAINQWDYEHLVLQHFPWVYKVLCLANTDPRCLCRHPKNEPSECCCEQVAPGHILIVPISNLRNRNAVDILKPRTGRRTLIQIEEYLKKITSPFAHIHARNPLFEEVKTSFNVKFYTGTDKGRYLKQLNEDIIRFLSPWAFDETKEIIFGRRIYASNLINYIEELDYVDYITCFKMVHIVNDCCNKDTHADIPCIDLKRNLNPQLSADKAIMDRFVTEIEATSSRAILTSVKKHCIELIEEPKGKDDCNCEN